MQSCTSICCVSLPRIAWPYSLITDCSTAASYAAHGTLLLAGTRQHAQPHPQNYSHLSVAIQFSTILQGARGDL